MFDAITVQKPYEQVVSQIAGRIERGELRRGDRLPSETRLQAQFGVSIRVVREAIKVLEAMGLVEVRHGSGMYVRHDTVPAVTRAITLSLTPDERSLASMLEARLPLEAQCVRFAVVRGSGEQLEEIDRIAKTTLQAATEGDYDRFSDHDLAFHDRIARASGNAYLRVILAAIVPLVSELNELMQRRPGSLQIAAEQHCRIAEGILAGNADAAERAMREHIEYALSVRASEPDGADGSPEEAR